MKTITFENLNNIFESEENFEDIAVDAITKNIKMFSDIELIGVSETEDYILISLNSSNPDKARNELSSYNFSNTTNLIFDTIRKTKGNGYCLAVYDEDGDPFDKNVIVQIRKGKQFNAGVSNEIDFINAIQNSIDNGQDCIMFEAHSGRLTSDTGFVIRNIESVRDCSKESGSRTGNRADIEITTTNGIKHRISLKKDNGYKVAGLVKKFATQKHKIGKIVRQYFQDKNIPFSDKYITIKITDEELYKWCWFGNDIDKNGAVIIGTLSKEKPEEKEDCTLIPVSDIINPNTATLELIDTYPIYFLMKMNKHGSVDILAAVFGTFGVRYLIDDLSLPGVNESLNESNKIEESKPSDYYSHYNAISQNESMNKELKLGIFHGYHIYTDEVNGIFHTKYTIKDYGLRGMTYIDIVSITNDKIKFRDLKYNETTNCYEPDEHVCTFNIKSKEPCKSRKRKGGFGMEDIQ